MPDWDVAHALTSQREQINPRPVDEAIIFRSLMPYVTDFITYSEGANDDVNKFVWSGLGWDPKADVTADPARVQPLLHRRPLHRFVRPGAARARAQLARPARREHASVYTTLEQFQAMEQAAAPRDLLNWRFQQALYRAYYDAYVRSRLLHETAIEERALDAARAPRRPATRGRRSPTRRQILDEAQEKPSPEWRLRVYTLAEALFQSIRQQLSVVALPRDCGRTRRHARQLRDCR